MNQIEKSILNQMWIYCAAIRTLISLKVTKKYSAQVDMTIDNLHIASQMLLTEARRQAEEIKKSVNVKV